MAYKYLTRLPKPRFMEMLEEQAKAEGLASGLSQGLSQGLDQGMTQGIQKGIAEGLISDIVELVSEGDLTPERAKARLRHLADQRRIPEDMAEEAMSKLG